MWKEKLVPEFCFYIRIYQLIKKILEHLMKLRRLDLLMRVCTIAVKRILFHCLLFSTPMEYFCCPCFRQPFNAIKALMKWLAACWLKDKVGDADCDKERRSDVQILKISMCCMLFAQSSFIALLCFKVTLKSAQLECCVVGLFSNINITSTDASSRWVRRRGLTFRAYNVLPVTWILFRDSVV